MLRNTVMPEQVVLLKNIHSRDIFLRGIRQYEADLQFSTLESVYHVVVNELNVEFSAMCVTKWTFEIMF